MRMSLISLALMILTTYCIAKGLPWTVSTFAKWIVKGREVANAGKVQLDQEMAKHSALTSTTTQPTVN